MYSLRYCPLMIAICCACVNVDMVTPNSISLEKDDLQTLIHELIKTSVHDEVSALTIELQEAKSQLAEARLYLGQTIIALSSGSKADSTQDEGDTESVHVIERRSVPESDVSHDDVLSSLSLHDLIPLLSSRCRDGKDGINGKDGKDGRDGIGRDGKDGRDGLPGPPGSPGAHGSAGLPGVRGPSGAPGLPGNTSESGSVYTRWGRTTCDGDTSLLYHGFAAAAYYHSGGAGGGGVNYQCLHPQPEYNNYNNDGVSSIISGTEYDSQHLGLFPNAAHNQNVPCARCYTSRSAVVMIPSRRSCNSGWTKEYEGYLMANIVGHNQPTTYECVDGEPEYIAGLSGNTDGARFYFVKPDCSSTGTIGHCPPYYANKQLTCVVCSR